MAILLGGCGGGEPPTTAAPPSDAGTECIGTPRQGVALDAAARACADNGFDPTSDEFSFPNWGDPGTLDSQVMVALFGPEAVCASGASKDCILLPAAQDWMD